MARSRDLFDDTTMTFGEHLEVLRIHVFKALIGLVVAVVLALFFGDRIFAVLRTPVEEALRERGIENVTVDAPRESFFSYLSRMFSESEPPQDGNGETTITEELREDQLRVSARISDLAAALRKAGLTVQPAPQSPDNDDAPVAAADGNPGNSGPQDPDGPPAAAAEGPDASVENTPAAAGGAATDEPPSVEIVIQAPEFAQLRKVVNDRNKLQTLRIEEGFLAYMKVSIVAGFALSAPWIFYQIWQFVAAGLHPHERRYVYIYMPMSVGLFLAGALAGYYYAFPLMLRFLISFSEWLGLVIQPRLSDYISLVLLMPLMFGISFQLPLVMLFLERLGIFTQEAYKQNWRIAVLVISVVSMILTPQDPGSMVLMMLPLVFLYVVGIWLCRFQVNPQRSPIS